MGCPDAVRGELANLKGLLRAEYLTDQDLFVINFRPEMIKPEDILAAVWLAGKKQGREFIPEVLPAP